MSDPISRLRGAGIPTDRIEEYRAAWGMFESDVNGVLTAGKLGRLLNDTFSQNYTPDDLAYMLRQFGEGDAVDFFTFAMSLHNKLGDPRYNEAFGDAFDLLDVSRVGELSREDLVAGMQKLGETLTDAEAEEMLKIAKTKDGFVKAMSNALATNAQAAVAVSTAGPSAAPQASPAASGPTPGAGAPSPARPAGGPRPAPGNPSPSPAAGPGGPRPARPGPPGPGGPGPRAPRPPGA